MTIDWRRRAAALAARVAAAAGVAPDWASVFAEVPRHLFVPSFYPTLDANGVMPPARVDGSDPTRRGEWLDAVYDDRSLVTRCALTPGTEDLWQSISSSTRPSLMARMLTLLDTGPDRGHRILEIGTGTGYNAAILGRRVGAHNVHSVDLDPGIVNEAQVHLASVGLPVTVVAGDGAAGLASGAPYDRILATCAVPTVPATWVEQLAPDGVVVADIRGGLASSLFLGRATTSGAISGRFLDEPGHFMWLRRYVDNPLRDGGSFRTQIDYGEARHRRVSFTTSLLDDPKFRFLLQLVMPETERVWISRGAGTARIRLAGFDGSWAELDPETRDAAYGGESDLLDGLERTELLWEQHQHPGPARFGITAGATRTVWIDTPEQVVLAAGRSPA